MEFFRRKLKNGITVIMEQRDLPVVALCIANPIGGAYEPLEIKGVAHVIEHLLFTGTKTRSNEEISSEIEKKGGILNAFTADEVTSYWFKLPSKHIFAGLAILTDMLNNCTFKEEKFEKEQNVVLEEIKMYDDNPRLYCLKKLVENLYDAPFGVGVIGKKETVSSLKRDFVVKFFEEAYNPKNFIVAVVGDADFDKICNYIEENFKPSKAPATKKVPIRKKNSDIAETRPGIDQAHLYFGMHSPLPSHEDSYAFEILNAYLADGMSSRLFLEIREKRGLAYAVHGEISTEKDYSFYTIYVGTNKNAIPEVRKLILEGFDSVQKMTEKELEELKEKLIGLRKVCSEESDYVMKELLFEELRGNAEKYYVYEEKIKNVKLADVKRLAKIKNYSIATLVPEG
jgi:predicted Zn-dependent peptidase